MGFGLYSLLEAGLLVMNAIAILHEERFLCKYGLGRDAAIQGYQQPGVKTQLMNVIYSVKLAKIPLIILNTICIVVKLIW